MSVVYPIYKQQKIVDKYFDTIISLRQFLGTHIGDLILIKNDNYVLMDKLIIDVNHEDSMMLSYDRDNVYETGGFNYDFTYVDALITYKNKLYEADIRLKGDDLINFQNDQWSFRIKIKDDHLDGMRIFSLHHPKIGIMFMNGYS